MNDVDRENEAGQPTVADRGLDGDGEVGADQENEAGYVIRDRRPMGPRDWRVMGWLADGLVRWRIPANAVSALSIVFALASGMAMALTGMYYLDGHPLMRWYWLGAGVGIELRAICNLLDGMVAERSGEASAVGELYNEVPDRFSDVAMLVGLGWSVNASPTLGWVCAVAAVLVAYVRAQAVAAGAPQNYRGVMSKPIRMQLVAVLCFVYTLAPPHWHWSFWGPRVDLFDRFERLWGATDLVLFIILAGCTLTITTRLLAAEKNLRSQSDQTGEGKS